MKDEVISRYVSGSLADHCCAKTEIAKIRPSHNTILQHFCMQLRHHSINLLRRNGRLDTSVYTVLIIIYNGDTGMKLDLLSLVDLPVARLDSRSAFAVLRH